MGVVKQEGHIVGSCIIQMICFELFISHQSDQFLTWSYIKIWSWKIQGQGHGWGQRWRSHRVDPVSNWCTSFLFHINRTNQRQYLKAKTGIGYQGMLTTYIFLLHNKLICYNPQITDSKKIGYFGMYETNATFWLQILITNWYLSTNSSDAINGILQLWGPIPWLLMLWLQKSPEHRQAWYWLLTTDLYFCSRLDFIYLFVSSQIQDIIQNVNISL